MQHVYAYRYRWLVLLSLVLLTVAIEIPWMNLAPLGRSVNAFYQGVWNGSWQISDTLIMVYMIGFVMCALPSAWFISKCGVTNSVYFSGILVALGSVVRVSAYRDPRMMILSQALYAVAQVVVLNLGVTTVARWFPIRERGMAMGILSAMQYATLGAAMALPGLISYDFVFNVFLGSLICAVCAALGALFIRENPPTPSSLVEPAKDEKLYEGSHSMLSGGRSLRGVIIIFSIIWGVLMAMLGRIDYLAEQLDMPSTSKFALALIASGALGAIILPILSDYSRKRKWWYALCIGAALPGLLMMVYGVGNRMQVYVGACVFGFFAFSSIPIGLQYGAELGYKFPETRIQALMTFLSQAVGICVMFVSMEGSVMEQRYNMAFFVGLLLACFFGCTFLDESPMIITEDERLDMEIRKEIVQTE